MTLFQCQLTLKAGEANDFMAQQRQLTQEVGRSILEAYPVVLTKGSPTTRDEVEAAALANRKVPSAAHYQSNIIAMTQAEYEQMKADILSVFETLPCFTPAVLEKLNDVYLRYEDDEK